MVIVLGLVSVVVMLSLLIRHSGRVTGCAQPGPIGPCNPWR
jgi:hypothetical protein